MRKALSTNTLLGMSVKFRDPASKARRAFAKRLQAARIAAGYETRSAFADKLGSEHETYRRWERAETEPSIHMLVRISDATQKSLDFLIRGSNDYDN